jgi:hypothetical protein
MKNALWTRVARYETAGDLDVGSLTFDVSPQIPCLRAGRGLLAVTRNRVILGRVAVVRKNFESRGSKTVFVMESAENGLGIHGIGLCATVS